MGMTSFFGVATNCSVEGSVNGIWDSFWNSKTHKRLKKFGWRAFAKVLPTRDLLGRRLGFANTSCLVCRNATESTFHIFNECLELEFLLLLVGGEE